MSEVCSVKLYTIRKWNELFENNRSRELVNLRWTVIPNRHDGETYTRMVTHKDGAKMFAAWVLILQVASKCEPRGTLVRGDGTPLNSVALSLKTRAPMEWFDLVLEWLEKNSDWLEIKPIPHMGATIPHPPAVHPAPRDEEGKGKKGRERIYSPAARVVVHYLNERSGKKFRETAANLGFIDARLSEEGVDLEGVKVMIDRQVRMWKGTEMDKYLRPETLFNSTKFDSYYASKDQPIPQGNGKPYQKSLLEKEIDRL